MEKRVQGFKGSREGTDTTDLLICEVRPYLSSFGNFAVITPAIKYLNICIFRLIIVIPAKAGIQEGTGCRIKSGMTELDYLIARLTYTPNSLVPIQPLIEVKRHSLFESYLFKALVSRVEDVVTFSLNNCAWYF